MRGSGGGRGSGSGQGRGGSGKGRGGGGRGGGFGSGPSGYCVCPRCGDKLSHQRGVPCFETQCPNCGERMTRDIGDIGTDTTRNISPRGNAVGPEVTGIPGKQHPEVDQGRCVGCGVCADACPVDAIVIEGGKARIEADICRNCGACISSCPQGAIR